MPYALLVVSFFLSPLRVLAKTGNPSPPPCPEAADGKLCNPLQGITDLNTFIKAILDIVLTIGIPIVALAIIYCGFLFVSAQGKPEEISKAKKALMYTLIGAAVLLGAWVLAQAIGDTVDELRKSVQ